VRRRDFITLLGGAVATWPLAARAQQMRRIGVMIALPESDPELKKWLAAFRQALERLGWSECLFPMGELLIADFSRLVRVVCPERFRYFDLGSPRGR
jgi:hypothetical protein